MIGLHCVCSNLVSYKYKEELLKEVFHIKEGQKCCCFYSKVNALCRNKRRQIICSYSALVNQAKPFESTQSHYASCTKSRWTDSWHKLNALIHGKHSAESNSNSTRCLSPCSTSLFPHFLTPEKSKGNSFARVSSWSLVHDCRLVLQSQHMTHSTDKNISLQRHYCSLTTLWLDCGLYRRSELNRKKTMRERILKRNGISEPRN